MFLSNRAAYFVILTALIAECAACGQPNHAGGNTNFADDTSVGTVGFPTKEPDNYQADVLITAGGIEQRYRCARAGTSSRIDYDLESQYQRSFVHTDADRVVSDRLKIYADVPAGHGGGTELQNDAADNMLIRNHYTEIESLGVENGLSKFRAKIDQSAASDAVIYVDDALGMPVREEYYTVTPDGVRQVQYTYELRNVRNGVEPAMFQIPPGYKKVSIDEFAAKTRKDQ